MRSSPLAPLALCVALFACATTGTRNTGPLYAMPNELSDAIAPERADPENPGELAESALYLLDPERPGGPDYLGAARMCLLAAEVAEPGLEDPLATACYRTAARSALRSGDRDLYVEVVGTWEQRAPRAQQQIGELAVHRSIRDRLTGREPRYDRRLPAEVRQLVPPVEGGS
jgi:hypothetical protein